MASLKVRIRILIFSLFLRIAILENEAIKSFSEKD